MASCPKIDRCPLFPLFEVRDAVRQLRDQYCNGDHRACERFKRSTAGHIVPMNLLPDGSTLDTGPDSRPRAQGPESAPRSR